MSDKSKCKWSKAWVGPCNEPTVGEGGFCQSHSNQKCSSCGGIAVRECDHTGIQFVCGYPLCATCQHGVPKKGDEGWFMLGGGHVTAEVHEQQIKEMY